jgi:Heparinase II/III-like protein/Heparinase II/III N-terminus
MLARVKRMLGRDAANVSGESGFEAELARAGLAREAWVATLDEAPRLYGALGADDAKRLARRFPAAAAAVCEAAENFRAHRFDLLGSGPFVPDDPDRPTAADGYRPIDWFLDPVRNLRFPRDVPHKSWDLYRMRPGNADVKYPWELARCQHLVTLAQAWLIMGEARYAVEVPRQILDFAEANPVGIGINWTCTMDVAIRAANWALALSMVRGAPDASARGDAFGTLFEHGAFIRANLEDEYEVTSNHFLSNVVGLFFLGRLFADLPSGAAWERFARTCIEREIDVQVLADGADFESSIPYHRLVTELFLGSLRLADFAGAPLSANARAKVGDMARYHAAMLRPDGMMPVVGDADDGRLHIFTRPFAPQDGRHLLAPAAHILGDESVLKGSGTAGAWDAAWWGLETDAGPSTTLPSAARLFPEAGHAVFRDGGRYLLITNAVVGTEGFGNHKHNDQLGFEFHADGRALVVDPGSHVYTGDPGSRNRFRATAAHNTLAIDGAEQNDFNPEWLFRMFAADEPPKHLAFDAGPDRVEYVGTHAGYRRLDPPAAHERRFRLLRPAGALFIGDRVIREGAARLDWTFQLAPGVEIAAAEPDAVCFAAGESLYCLASLDALEAVVEEGAYSPSYGVSRTAARVRFRHAAAHVAGGSWSFLIAPADWLATGDSAGEIASFLAWMAEGPGG